MADLLQFDTSFERKGVFMSAVVYLCHVVTFRLMGCSLYVWQTQYSVYCGILQIPHRASRCPGQLWEAGTTVVNVGRLGHSPFMLLFMSVIELANLGQEWLWPRVWLFPGAQMTSPELCFSLLFLVPLVILMGYIRVLALPAHKQRFHIFFNNFICILKNVFSLAWVSCSIVNQSLCPG